ncbi:MAG: hypothetical protein WC623_24310 [Pedobacter sp.]|uniref:hypothetical protein n=1 Tax=Pedobacter sp. TaxID=1411316 RepID=UPI003561D9D1
MCSKCFVIENTATSNYWNLKEGEPQLCSACDPAIGVWHGRFEKKSAIGCLLGSDGFLYSKEEEDKGDLNWRKENQGLTLTSIKAEK